MTLTLPHHVDDMLVPTLKAEACHMMMAMLVLVSCAESYLS